MSFLTDSIIVFSKQKIKITIHINIFLPSNKEECYFEMGILAKNENEVETSIEILLPIKSAKFRFEDLSHRFKENSDYLRLIFNQTSSINKGEEFEINGKKTIFGEIRDDDVLNDKIILKVNKDRSKNYYFRFRLKGIERERLCLEKETTSFAIDPFKRFINVSGFHINNIRNDKNRQLDLKENQISIKEINTFFICDITATLIDSSIPKQSFRLLEENIWEDYISNDINKIDDFQKKIIYQFKKMNDEQKENIKDFKLFVKTSHIDRSMRAHFLAIIILIAISANALYAMLTPTFNNLGIILVIMLLAILYNGNFTNFFLAKIKKLRDYLGGI